MSRQPALSIRTIYLDVPRGTVDADYERMLEALSDLDFWHHVEDTVRTMLESRTALEKVRLRIEDDVP